jgi:hypothetical protein
VFLRRHADFLLLEVTVTNDTREADGREDEIYRTLRNALTAAERQRDVQISVVNDDGLVYPLTAENYKILLSPGGRPDTSLATISIVDPHQYRGEIIDVVTSEVRKVTSALGSEYRVVVQEIDRPVEWFRLGLLDLGLFVPYEYTVIPQNVTAFTIDEC